MIDLQQHQQEREHVIAEFTRDWDWQKVLDLWRQRMDANAISLAPFFTHVTVHDPALPRDRPPAFSWWPHDSIHKRQKDLQRHLNQAPGTRGPVHSWVNYTRQGEVDTLNYLWENRDSPDTLAAILITASLFSRLHSSRYCYPRDTWPPRDCIQALEGWAYDAWPDQERYRGWHHSCTQVLPDILHDYGRPLTDIASVVAYLAEEHATGLRRYCPVVIDFEAQPDPTISLELAIERELEKKWWTEWEEKQAKLRERQQEERQRREQDHPRAGEWRTLPNDELQRLVWTKSTIALAKEFDVSATTIANRCRKEGIPKPSRGFWRKVEAGKIPHPNGTPVIEQ